MLSDSILIYVDVPMELLSHRFHRPSEEKQALLNQDYFLTWGSKRGELNPTHWGWEIARDQPRAPSGPSDQKYLNLFTPRSALSIQRPSPVMYSNGFY